MGKTPVNIKRINVSKSSKKRKTLKRGTQTSKHRKISTYYKKKILSLALKMGGLFVVLISIFFLLVYTGAFGPIPSIKELKRIKNPVASEVYSADGQLLGRYYIQNRSNVSFSEISPNVINALIATEDARFYEHKGIDEWALLRVLAKTIILRDQSAGGGSTLSQQIAKNIWHRKDFKSISMPVNKLRESIIAYRLENVYSKEEILTLYLNTVPFGENTFGIETAAERFFSTPPGNLTVPQAACLIGMLKANTAYNPRLYPENSLFRRNVVIGQMVKYGFLTEEEGKEYKKAPLDLKYNYLTHQTGLAPYFRERIRPQLEEWCNNQKGPDGKPYNLYTHGLKIITTIDSRMQQYAENAVKEHMKTVQETFKEHWAGEDPWGKNYGVVERAIQRSNRYKNMKAAGKSEDEIKEAFSTPTSTKLFSWNDEIEKQITPLDSVKHSLQLLHCGFMAMNPSTGAIKAWVGGNDYQWFQYDHITARRQVGSIFKPLVFTAALEDGVESDKYYTNEEITYPEYDDWTPQNADGRYGGYYSMQGALANSVNTVSVQVLQETGIDKVIDLAQKLGINSELPEVPSIALGTAEISLLEMLTAYSVFPTGGYKSTPDMLLRIEDGQGKILKEFEPAKKEKIISDKNAKIMTHMLEAVIDSGTGHSIRDIYHIESDIAGKTGTTQNGADGWFVAFTPSLVSGCWVGAEDPQVHFRTTDYGQGAYLALPVVGKFFNQLSRDATYAEMTNREFTPPGTKTIAMLDIPHYRETLAKVRKFDFGKIFGFGRKEKKEILKKNEDEEQAKQSRKERKKGKRRPIWERIKDALKKE